MNIFVTGHKGMVGSALVRRIDASTENEVITADRQELDLTNQDAVFSWLEERRPDCVIIAAAKVGGIHANATYPADFIYENLVIAANLVEGSRRAEVGRVLFLGSSCIYPKMAPQPMAEEALLTGPLEITNEAYAVAKIAGLKLCQYYRAQHGVLYHSAMPTNLYGPGDNYHPENSHVLPALIRRFHEAKERNLSEVRIWGTGTPKREFLHVDDLAEACCFLLEQVDPPDWVNLGSGVEITILELAKLVAEIIGFEGEVKTDPSKPDGTPRKLMNNKVLRGMGWEPSITLKEGIKSAYEDFRSSVESGAIRK